jgi:hypothetical protein
MGGPKSFQLFGFSKPRNFAFLALLSYLTRLNIGFLTACGCILFNVLPLKTFAANVGPDSVKLLHLTIEDPRRSINPSKEGFNNSRLGFFPK